MVGTQTATAVRDRGWCGGREREGARAVQRGGSGREREREQGWKREGGAGERVMQERPQCSKESDHNTSQALELAEAPRTWKRPLTMMRRNPSTPSSIAKKHRAIHCSKKHNRQQRMQDYEGHMSAGSATAWGHHTLLTCYHCGLLPAPERLPARTEHPRRLTLLTATVVRADYTAISIPAVEWRQSALQWSRLESRHGQQNSTHNTAQTLQCAATPPYSPHCMSSVHSTGV